MDGLEKKGRGRGKNISLTYTGRSSNHSPIIWKLKDKFRLWDRFRLYIRISYKFIGFTIVFKSVTSDTYINLVVVSSSYKSSYLSETNHIITGSWLVAVTLQVT